LSSHVSCCDCFRLFAEDYPGLACEEITNAAYLDCKVHLWHTSRPPEHLGVVSTHNMGTFDYFSIANCSCQIPNIYIDDNEWELGQGHGGYLNPYYWCRAPIMPLPR
jgi:hypothetical protein